MKIVNAKGLTRFASSGVQPDKVGFLEKRGDLNKGYQRRWFVLKGNLLFYYEKQSDKEPIGVVVLEGCRIEMADREDVDNYAFQITFPGSATRTYILSADSQEEMESWMKVLSCAPYDYVRLVVGELQNQLQEKQSADNARLVQAAERDSRMLGRVYSEDFTHRRLVQRPPPPKKQERATYPANKSNSFDAHRKQSQQNHLCDVRDGNAADCSFETVDASLPSYLRVNTWQVLGISNFYEMHDEIRRQIKEFSGPVSEEATGGLNDP